MKTNELTPTPRERVSVAITGIDRSTPDVIVEDGKCEKLHNARYSGGAWRPTHRYMLKHSLPDDLSEYTIVYHHPAAGDNTYIAVDTSSGEYYSLTFNDDAEPTLKSIAQIRDVTSISHFGNVLMLMATDTYYFILKNGAYQSFIIPPYMRTEVKSFTSSFALPSQVRTGDRQAGYGYPWDEYEPSTTPGINDAWDYRGAWFPIHNITQDVPLIPTKDGMWNGELLLFTTWRMADGTNLSPSPLHLLKSYDSPNNIPDGYTRSISIAPSPRELFLARQNGDKTSSLDKYLAITIQANNLADGNTLAPKTEQFTRCWLPNVRINIPTDADTSSVTHVAVWVTRIHPIFDTSLSNNIAPMSEDNFRQGGGSSKTDTSFTGFYDTTNLADQPFYLLKEIPVEDIVNNDDGKYIDIALTSSLLDNVVTNAMYQPNNNAHSLTSGTSLDYNNRLHHGDPTVKLTASYNLGDGFSNEDNIIPQKDVVEVIINDSPYSILSTSQRSNAGVSEKSPYTHILSYPDYRAKSIRADGIGTFTFKPATANNFAWYHAPHTEQEKYPPIDIELRALVLPEETDNSIVHQPNRIQVSATNNPFSFPFENSYSVGSSNNRIIALQSAAIEMPEMKVGELPLYAFTEEGIFALIAGSETLYARVSAINYDKIINPNTLAINGAIAYITEKGVHLLTSNGSQVISTPIHDKGNRPPLDFLRTCKMIYPKEHNEIILHNEDNGDGTAYVYNLDNGYWSTRLLQGIKLNTDEMYYGGTLFDLANEDENKAMDISIVTRPIKLGDVEFKRIESVVPRIASNDHDLSIDIDITGSVDGGDYHSLRSESLDIAPNKVNPITIRRTPFSAKYFKMDFLLYTDDGNTFNPSFSHIDIEWYRKLRHRMR